MPYRLSYIEAILAYDVDTFRPLIHFYKQNCGFFDMTKIGQRNYFP